MGLQDDILKLRGEGLSYRQIEDRLGCSKGTIAYHCGAGQKDKTLARTRVRRRNVLRVKMEAFKYGKPPREAKGPVVEYWGDPRSVLRGKRAHFSRIGNKSKHEGYNFMFTLDDLQEKIGDDPRCYWTNRSIDLGAGHVYQLDHLVARASGGDNSLANCVLACREANQGRSDTPGDGYVQVCCEVAVHRGKEILARMLARDKEFRNLLIQELRSSKEGDACLAS